MSHVDKNVKKCNNRVGLRRRGCTENRTSAQVLVEKGGNRDIMKSTGIVRGLDKMGRIVLPIEIRKMLHLVDDKSSVEFYTDADMVILKKYVPACMFCDEANDLIEFKGIKICRACLKKINQMASGTGGL